MSDNAWQCPYAPRGRRLCPSWRCDCFVMLYPDDPLGLHPEAFVVGVPQPDMAAGDEDG